MPILEYVVRIVDDDKTLNDGTSQKCKRRTARLPA